MARTGMEPSIGKKGETRGLPLFLGCLLTLALSIAVAGCNALVGNDEHGLAEGDAAQVAPTSGASSGAAGTAGDGAVRTIADGSVSGSASSGLGDAAASGGSDGGGAPFDATTDVASSGGMDASPGPDGATDAGMGADASSCDPLTPFTSTTMVGGLPTGVEIHGRLSPDETTIWFDTNGGIIYVGTRPSLDAVFSYKGLAADGTAISFTGNDVYPTVSDDLKTLYFLNGDSNQITAATRADAGLPFSSDGGALPLASPPGALYRTPFVAGATLYYGLYATALPGSEIYFSSISGNTISPPQALSGFPLPGAAGTEGVDGERYPVVARDGNTIYFRDSIFIDSGVGQVGEIYVAHRAQSSDAFVTGSVVEELDSELGEEPLWLSLDQCRLYFMSFRSPAGLYVAAR